MATGSDGLDYVAMKDKIAIVTGSNTGIGYETALELARRGAEVILAVRSNDRGKSAATQISKETGFFSFLALKVSVEELDLSDLNSVRQFAERFKQKFNRLDILVNNAGVFMNNYTKTKDGFEMHFGVNHLGHFLLTNLLLDLLKKSAPSRIVNVSSELYKMGSIHWDDINLEHNFGLYKGYSQSKLANVLFTLELAKRLEGTGVTSVSLTPGFVNTEISRNYTGFFGWLQRLVQPYLGLTPKQGAQTVIYCTVSPDIPNHSGNYFNKSKVEKIPDKVLQSDEASRLWNMSASLVGLKAEN